MYLYTESIYNHVLNYETSSEKAFIIIEIIFQESLGKLINSIIKKVLSNDFLL